MSTDPLRAFEEEHTQALDALARLEAAALALEGGAAPAPHLEAVREAHTILTTVVREHNEKEEVILFPVLEGRAPTSVFIQEHRELRALEERLGRALDGTGSLQAATEIALAIVDLLRAHIAREDEVLFPAARSVLGVEGLAAVARRLGQGDDDV